MPFQTIRHAADAPNPRPQQELQIVIPRSVKLIPLFGARPKWIRFWAIMVQVCWAKMVQRSRQTADLRQRFPVGLRIPADKLVKKYGPRRSPYRPGGNLAEIPRLPAKAGTTSAILSRAWSGIRLRGDAAAWEASRTCGPCGPRGGDRPQAARGRACVVIHSLQGRTNPALLALGQRGPRSPADSRAACPAIARARRAKSGRQAGRTTRRSTGTADASTPSTLEISSAKMPIRVAMAGHRRLRGPPALAAR